MLLSIVISLIVRADVFGHVNVVATLTALRPWWAAVDVLLFIASGHCKRNPPRTALSFHASLGGWCRFGHSTLSSRPTRLLQGVVPVSVLNIAHPHRRLAARRTRRLCDFHWSVSISFLAGVLGGRELWDRRESEAFDAEVSEPPLKFHKRSSRQLFVDWFG